MPTNYRQQYLERTFQGIQNIGNAGRDIYYSIRDDYYSKLDEYTRNKVSANLDTIGERISESGVDEDKVKETSSEYIQDLFNADDLASETGIPKSFVQSYLKKNPYDDQVAVQSLYEDVRSGYYNRLDEYVDAGLYTNSDSVANRVLQSLDVEDYGALTSQMLQEFNTAENLSSGTGIPISFVRQYMARSEYANMIQNFEVNAVKTAQTNSLKAQLKTNIDGTISGAVKTPQENAAQWYTDTKAKWEELGGSDISASGVRSEITFFNDMAKANTAAVAEAHLYGDIGMTLTEFKKYYVGLYEGMAAQIEASDLPEDQKEFFKGAYKKATIAELETQAVSDWDKIQTLYIENVEDNRDRLSYDIKHNNARYGNIDEVLEAMGESELNPRNYTAATQILNESAKQLFLEGIDEMTEEGENAIWAIREETTSASESATFSLSGRIVTDEEAEKASSGDSSTSVTYETQEAKGVAYGESLIRENKDGWVSQSMVDRKQATYADEDLTDKYVTIKNYPAFEEWRKKYTNVEDGDNARIMALGIYWNSIISSETDKRTYNALVREIAQLSSDDSYADMAYKIRNSDLTAEEESELLDSLSKLLNDGITSLTSDIITQGKSMIESYEIKDEVTKNVLLNTLQNDLDLKFRVQDRINKSKDGRLSNDDWRDILAPVIDQQLLGMAVDEYERIISQGIDASTPIVDTFIKGGSPKDLDAKIMSGKAPFYNADAYNLAMNSMLEEDYDIDAVINAVANQIFKEDYKKLSDVAKGMVLANVAAAQYVVNDYMYTCDAAGLKPDGLSIFAVRNSAEHPAVVDAENGIMYSINGGDGSVVSMSNIAVTESLYNELKRGNMPTVSDSYIYNGETVQYRRELTTAQVIIEDMDTTQRFTSVDEVMEFAKEVEVNAKKQGQSEDQQEEAYYMAYNYAVENMLDMDNPEDFKLKDIDYHRYLPSSKSQNYNWATKMLAIAKRNRSNK